MGADVPELRRRRRQDEGRGGAWSRPTAKPSAWQGQGRGTAAGGVGWRVFRVLPPLQPLSCAYGFRLHQRRWTAWIQRLRL